MSEDGLPENQNKTNMSAGSKIALGCLGLLVVAAIIIYVSVQSYFKNGYALFDGYVSHTPPDHQIARFISNNSAKGSFLKTFGDVSEYSPCSNAENADRCIMSESIPTEKPRDSEVCKATIAWAESLGAREYAGNPDLKFNPYSPGVLKDEQKVQQSCVEAVSMRIYVSGSSSNSSSFTMYGLAADKLPFIVTVFSFESSSTGSGSPDSYNTPLPPGQTPPPLVSTIGANAGFSYTIDLATAKHGVHANWSSTSYSWKTQVAGFLNTVAYARYLNRAYPATDAALTNLAVKDFQTRFSAGGSWTPIRSTDGSVSWIDVTTADSSKVCLAIPEQIVHDAGDSALSGEAPELTSANAIPASSAAVAKFGDYVKGGCSSVDTKTSKVVAPMPPLNQIYTRPAFLPTTAAKYKDIVCGWLGAEKAVLSQLTEDPWKAQTDLTVTNFNLLNHWSIRNLMPTMNNYNAHVSKKLVLASSSVELLETYLKRAAEYYPVRAVEGQYPYLSKTANIGDFFTKAFLEPSKDSTTYQDWRSALIDAEVVCGK